MPEISRHGPEAIDEVRHLWLALRDHHASVQPERGATRDDDETWAMCSSAYRRWLAEAGAFVLLARDDDAVVGYALVRPDEPSATWRHPGRPALLEALSVAPAARGGGIGAALMARVREECRGEGYDALMLGVVAGNRAAQRFYERQGFAPSALVLMDTTYRP